jgi:signal transduction histidine kinase
MKIAIVLFFLVIAFVMLGLLFASKPYFTQQAPSRPSLYWPLALGLNALAIFLFALHLAVATDLENPSLIATLANLILISALLFQAIFFRSLRTRIDTKFSVGAVFISLLFGAVFETFKLQTNAAGRIISVGSFMLPIIAWQIYEVFKSARASNSHQLNFLLYTTSIEFILTAARIVVVANIRDDLISIEQATILLVIVTWVLLAAQVLGYSAMNGYWAEHIAKQNASFESDSIRIHKLLAEQTKLINDLSRLNKMASAGALTASIAHELSQPIQSLSLNAELVHQLSSDRSPPSLKTLTEISLNLLEDVRRTVDIVSTLRNVFTHEKNPTQVLCLSTQLEKLNPLFQSQSAKFGITTKVILGSRRQINANSSELQQVALNIFNNACDALKHVEIIDKKISIQTYDEGEWVYCRIEDNGPGIPVEDQEEVFAILKSSKQSGMRIGLWLCKHIVERSHGNIWVENSLLGGAALVIRFPTFIRSSL